MEAQRRAATSWDDIKVQKKILEGEGATFHEMSWSEDKTNAILGHYENQG